MTGYVADLSWKIGARAIEKLDRLRSTLAILAWIIKSTKVDYGSECVNKYYYILEPDRPQMTMWCMRIACWIYKAKDKNSEYLILTAS